MDAIGPIEPAASNGHKFILVAIDYFTKWVEETSYKAVTKKVVSGFIRNRIVCRFGVPESIITDNGSNLNSDLMKAMCETIAKRKSCWLWLRRNDKNRECITVKRQYTTNRRANDTTQKRIHHVLPM